ncbi:MAG TPA: hypothetical protein PK256_10650, partial [Verrucomicrobiota bacterium]|nr:hypothetical protein [Verrucomicrobiota bacterium]
ARKLREDTTLTTEQRQAALQAVRAESEKAIVQTLGQSGLDRLKKQPGGMWLRMISPDPKP